MLPDEDTLEATNANGSVEPLDDLPLGDSLITEPNAQRAEYRRRKSQYNEHSIHPADLDAMLDKGWEVSHRGKRSVRLRQLKPHHQKLEDRAWILLYLMGYAELSGQAFAMKFRRENGSTGSKQIDAFASDAETAIVIECKSRTERGRRSLQKDIGETYALQNYIRQSIYVHYGKKQRPKIIWIYVTSNIIWSEPDLERASDANIYVTTENELNYFETFLKHMGVAGRYQLLGEFLKGQKIPAMSGVKVPAIRGTLGGQTF